MTTITLAALSQISFSQGAVVRLQLVPRTPPADCSVQAMTLALLQPGQRAWMWIAPHAVEGPIVELTARRSDLRARVRRHCDSAGPAVLGRLHCAADGSLTLHTDAVTADLKDAVVSWVADNSGDWPQLSRLRGMVVA